MDHIGIDVHKRESQIYILAEGGEVIERGRLQHPRSGAVDRGHLDAGHVPPELATADAAPVADGSSICSCTSREPHCRTRRGSSSGPGRSRWRSGVSDTKSCCACPARSRSRLAHRQALAGPHQIARALPGSSQRERCSVAHADGAPGPPDGGVGGSGGAFAELVDPVYVLFARNAGNHADHGGSVACGVRADGFEDRIEVDLRPSRCRVAQIVVKDSVPWTQITFGRSPKQTPLEEEDKNGNAYGENNSWLYLDVRRVRCGVRLGPTGSSCRY